MVAMVWFVTMLVVNIGIFPVPDAGIPIAGFELVQLIVDPTLAPQVTPGNWAPSQYTFDAGVVNAGTGFTVIVKLLAGPLQDPRCGITETVAKIGFAVVFVAVNDGTAPEPDAASPMVG
jgi:hypothetical protein